MKKYMLTFIVLIFVAIIGIFAFVISNNEATSGKENIDNKENNTGDDPKTSDLSDEEIMKLKNELF